MTVQTKPRVKHECAKCGRRDYAENMVYSRHTGKRYCRDLDCHRRRKR